MLPSRISSSGKSKRYRANGKLMLAGEYLVLAGARALALPVRFGQEMTITEHPGAGVRWTASDTNGTWFTCRIDPLELNVTGYNDHSTALRLEELLQAAGGLNPSFPVNNESITIETYANYPVEWGLGSSSTLIWLVAAWAGVDPYLLHRLVSAGSGYDLACAGRSHLLYYRLDHARPVISRATPDHALKNNTCFAYLGKKQDSRNEVRGFLLGRKAPEEAIRTISDLSGRICRAKSADELCLLVDEHESVLAKIMNRDPIGRSFPGFPGTVKSLGAWGGDFAMFVSGEPPSSVKKYLMKEGLEHVFTWSELVIEP
jgi:mevalonate kinase